MPIYEYICRDCNQITEQIQRVSDANLAKCPQCESDKVQKLISQSAFHLKGGGWYKDAYSSVPKTEGKKSDAASPSAATTDTKSGSKEAGKSPNEKPVKKAPGKPEKTKAVSK